MPNVADRLAAAMESTRSLACVGLDPVIEKLPRQLQHLTPAEAINAFSLGVLEAVAGVVPAVKFQSACYERHGPAALVHLQALIGKARSLGLVVILDAKRGDIGITAEHYAHAAFNQMGADYLTVNPYLGPDTLEPYLKVGGDRHGLFVLVRTSNPGSDAVQNLPISGESEVSVKTLAHAVGGIVTSFGKESLGTCGLSTIGAVVGATKSADAAALRRVMPDQVFLVPGFGAQGGRVEDLPPMLRESQSGRVADRGVLVTASRSVIYPDSARFSGKTWQDGVRLAAAGLNEELAQISR